MIVVKLHSGMGNQFFQYAIGRSLALKHNTQLVLDVGRFATDDLRDYKLSHFRIQAEIVEDFQSLKLLFEFPALLFKSRTGGLKDVNDKIWEMTPIDSISNNSILRGYWANDLYFKHIRGSLLKELRLKPRDETPHYKELKKQILATQSIALHIRRGDYLHDTNKDIFNLLGMEYYEKAIRFINEHIQNPVFFIFSDSVQWVKQNFTLPAQHEFVSDNVLLDFHEISLMQYCRHNIIANSTFSWWAAWLNANPNKIVIEPKQWYQKEEAQRAYEAGQVLHCPEFIRM